MSKAKKKLSKKSELRDEDRMIIVECISTKEQALVSYKAILDGFNPFDKNGKSKTGYEVKLKKSA